MDSFFVSVERKHDPSLIGKPVIVGGGPGGEQRRGVVASCSYEARAFGVRSAMPLAQAFRLCPQAVLVPVGTSDYGEATDQVREILESFTDRVEMSSPDEAYVDLEGTQLLHGPPIEAAEKIRRRIARETSLPLSVGLAASKTIAKIASKLAKPLGLFVAFPGQETALLRPFPIRLLPGLGPKTEELLKKRGVQTLGELIAFGEKNLAELLGEYGSDLLRRAMGNGASPVEPSRERVQISTEATFPEDVGDVRQLHAELARMTMKIGARLRRRDQWAGTLTLKLRYPDFRTLTRQTTLKPASHDDQVFLQTAKELLRREWDHRTPLRLMGVGVSGLVDWTQEELFESALEQKRERLLKTLDAVRGDQGKGKLFWGGAMEGEEPLKS